jgi:glycerate kinase
MPAYGIVAMMDRWQMHGRDGPMARWPMADGRDGSVAAMKRWPMADVRRWPMCAGNRDGSVVDSRWPTAGRCPKVMAVMDR